MVTVVAIPVQVVGTTNQTCDDCHCSFGALYRLPDEVWDRITVAPRVPGQVSKGVLCMNCADRRARAGGFNLSWVAYAVQAKRG